MGMNEGKLLRKALDGGLPRLLDLGFSPALVMEPYSTAFKRLIEHFTKYRALPSTAIAKEMFKDLGAIVALSKDCGDSAEVYWDKVLDDGLDGALVTAFEGITKLHVEDKLSGRTLLDRIMKDVREVADKYAVAGASSFTSEGQGKKLIDEYEQTKKGNLPGIPIDPNFPGLVDGLMSLRPAQITTITSRAKVGKTWLGLMLLLYAAQKGHRGLIASAEMIAHDLIRRIACLIGRLNFDAAIKGRLLPEQEKRYREIMEEADALKGVWANIRFMDQASITSVDAVERQAAQFDAALVLADAFYDFPCEVEEMNTGDDWKRIRYNLRAVRQVSLVTKRHWLLTAQFTKTARGFKRADDFAMGGTDAFNFISNSTIYLIQTERDKAANVVYVKIGKAREAPSSLPWKHHWNFIDADWRPIARYSPSVTGPRMNTKDL